MATLTFDSGPRAGESIDVSGELVIGREDAQLDIADPEISRRHAVIRPNAGGLEIEDLGSTNGTRVDGRRIDGVAPLADGARVAIGDSGFTVSVADPAATRAGAVPADAGATRIRAVEPTAADRGAREPAAPAAVVEPFGAHGPRARSAQRRGSVATRLWVPAATAIAIVVAAAIALILYFAAR